MSDEENAAKLETEIIFIIDSYSGAIFSGSNNGDFTGSVSEIDVRSAEASPAGRTISLLFGKLTTSDGQGVIYFFSKGGNQDTGVVLTGIQNTHGAPLNRVHGYVLLADSRYMMKSSGGSAYDVLATSPDLNPEQKTEGWFCIEQAKYEIQVLREIAPDKPLVIAVINQHLSNAMPLDKIRETLKPDANTRVFSCNPKDRESVKFVLLKLLDMCAPSPQITRMIDTFLHL